MLDKEVRGFLHAHGIRLNTDLGQHFLLREDVLEKIMDTAKVTAGDHVVEIGPGIGILTRELLKHAGRVTAIELDDRMIPLLKEFVTGSLHAQPDERLRILHANALHSPMPGNPYKVVANIPYHITSPLLTHLLLESEPRPTTLTLLIQREVAENICDHENGSILWILVGLFGTPTIAGLVPPEAFVPQPKVESAILSIDCSWPPRAEKKVIERILKLAKISFGQKRKMLSNTVGKLEGGMEALEKVGIDPKRRPQTLTIEEWITLEKVVWQ